MKDLLTRAIDAHGGLSRWREIETFQLKVSIGGGLWRRKGLPDGLQPIGKSRQPQQASISVANEAWVASAPKQPLKLEVVDLGPIAAEDVEIAVEHCGLCHCQRGLRPAGIRQGRIVLDADF